MISTYEKLIEDFEHGVYDFTVDGKCSGCGNCCSNLLWLSDNEITRIRRYIKKHKIKEQKHFVPAVLADPDVIDLTCPFLDESKENDKCVIYPVRPAICSSFICGKSEETRKRLMEKRATRKIVSMRDTFFDGK